MSELLWRMNMKEVLIEYQGWVFSTSRGGCMPDIQASHFPCPYNHGGGGWRLVEDVIAGRASDCYNCKCEAPKGLAALAWSLRL